MTREDIIREIIGERTLLAANGWAVEEMIAQHLDWEREQEEYRKMIDKICEQHRSGGDGSSEGPRVRGSAVLCSGGKSAYFIRCRSEGLVEDCGQTIALQDGG